MAIKVKRALNVDNSTTEKKRKKLKVSNSDNDDNKIKTKKEKNSSNESESTSTKSIKAKKTVKVNAEDATDDKQISDSDKKGIKMKQVKSTFKRHKPPKKPDWLEFKKAKKELKKTRKETNNPQYELNFKAKKIWEEVRNHNCDKDKRLPLTIELHSMLKGKFSSVIHSHDMARVVQFLLKCGNSEVRSSICEELLPHMVEVAKSKYACYCVKKLFVYNNNDNRKRLTDGFLGHVEKLLNHSISSKWLEYAYSTWATKEQKILMCQELYGNLFKISRDEKITNLSDLFKKDQQYKPAILSNVKSVLLKTMEKRHIMVSSLLHSVLLDYLNHCEEIDRNEILESLVESLLQLLTSRDGTIVAMHIIWYGTNKMKKTVVKMLKTHIKEVSELEHGHLLLLTVFDSVDDTVLVKKALIPELLSVAEEMAVDEIGRRVLLHLTAHRDTLYFHPAEIELLQKGDEIGTSKKDSNTKHQQLLESVINALLDYVAEKPAHWLGTPSVSMLTLAILKVSSCSDYVEVDKLNSAHNAIASYLIGDNDTKIVEDAALHFVLKKLIQHDQKMITDNKDKFSTTFSFALSNKLTESVLENWIKVNRACFLLVGLIETGAEDIAEQVKNKITKSVRDLLKNESTAGSKILLKKLNEKLTNKKKLKEK